MPGGVSFVISSFKENSIYICSSKRTKVGIRVNSRDRAFPGTEIFVLYCDTLLAQTECFANAPSPKCSQKRQKLQAEMERS